MKCHVSNVTFKKICMAFFLNVLFLLIYITIFKPYYETNDDIGMQTIIAGVHGESSAHIVYQNIIFGKVVRIFSELCPQINWYMLFMYGMIFSAFWAIVFVILKSIDGNQGILASVFLLTVLGGQYYVVFQWTRTAAILAIGGSILLLWSVERAETKRQKIIGMIVGSILVILGSMIRFDMLFMCLALIAGIAFLDIYRLFRTNEKKAAGRCLKQYFLLVGILGVVVVGLKVFDHQVYAGNPEWSDYLRYNQLRSELWDFGFPDYEDNQALYEELGISKKDLEYFQTWNMDKSEVTIEMMQKLADAKVGKTINAEFLGEFFKSYPWSLFKLQIFPWVLVLVVLNVYWKRENKMLLLYQMIMLMVLELYLFCIGRSGLPRVDSCVLSCVLVSFLYTLEPKAEYKLKREYLTCGIVILLICNVFSYRDNIFREEIDSTKAHAFFQSLTKSKHNLYVVTMGATPYRYSTDYAFWEAPQKGDHKNVYYTGGWETNMPTKNEMLERYQVENVYEESIDNPHMLWVAGDDAKMTEEYVAENYNKDAKMHLIKVIDEQKIWRLRSHEIVLDEDIEICEDKEEIVSTLKGLVSKGVLKLEGVAYKRETNSFRQYMYLKMHNKVTGEDRIEELVLSNNEESAQVRNGKFSFVDTEVKIDDIDKYEISIIMDADGDWYNVPFELYELRKN